MQNPVNDSAPHQLCVKKREKKINYYLLYKVFGFFFFALPETYRNFPIRNSSEDKLNRPRSHRRLKEELIARQEKTPGNGDTHTQQ